MSITILIAEKNLEAMQAEWNALSETRFRPYTGTEEVFTKTPHVLFTFAIGRVLFLRERNGYDDSDFIAYYLNEHGEVSSYEYATTRGWTYANGANVDATAEVQIRHNYLMRRGNVMARRSHQKAIHEACRKAKITRPEYCKLNRVYHRTERDAILKLLSTNLRSEFRISLATKVREWLADPAPKYKTPLSEKQMYFL